MKKSVAVEIAIIALLALIIILILAMPKSASANMQWFDTTYDFNYCYIYIGGVKIAEGKVKSWKDWDDSDMIQVKMYDDVTYYTHGSNVILVDR